MTAKADATIPSQLSVVTDVGLDHLDDVMRLFAHTWWTKDRNRTQVAASLAATPVRVGLADPANGQLVAFARAFSDGVYKALVMDVVVDESMRTRKIGHRLVQTVLAHPLVAAVEDVELYTNPARDRFYTELGFCVPDALQFMRRSRT